MAESLQMLVSPAEKKNRNRGTAPPVAKRRRVLPRSTTTGAVRIFHLHINPAFAGQDLNCVTPLERLAELVALAEVGGSAPSHYSYMGYALRPERLLRETVRSIVERMRQERVDAVVLIPV